MGGILATLERVPRSVVYANSVLLALLVALLDWVTGEEISVSFFYMIPILVVTWVGGSLPGFALNGFCAATRLVLVLRWQGPDLFGKPGLYWNLVVEGIFFVTLTLIAAALRRQHDQQSLLARTDALTGVANRRSFYERAELEISRARRLQEPLTVAYVDVDDFKKVNDALGHEAGDDLLRSVAATFVRRIRSTDLVARIGGDEFALLLSATNSGAARTLLGELYATLASEMGRHAWPVTFSIGAVTFLRPPGSVDDLLRHVDELMYAVKREGKANVKHGVFPEMPRGTVVPFTAEETPRA
ncbi:MAG TPA: GGDEF domain-containing protein [Thermoanaerobaculia bacterium]|nr:GGDEF domain-containing protein [Thermoanaerobaculia bacterium]HQR66330.1 GGDEF domain-containing protein [Thermoanaerobaculia bacterium]